MLDLARSALHQHSGLTAPLALLSPVNDAYGKPGLLPSKHRLEMCARSLEQQQQQQQSLSSLLPPEPPLPCHLSSLTRLDPWEAQQPVYMRTLEVMDHVRERITQGDWSGLSPPISESEASSLGRVDKSSRVVLVCGADLVHSFLKPGVWKDEHLAAILDPVNHGVVCIDRDVVVVDEDDDDDDHNGTGGQGGKQNGDRGLVTLIKRHNLLKRGWEAGGIMITSDPEGPSPISSTMVREKISRGESIGSLVGNKVEDYIQEEGLYRDSGRDEEEVKRGPRDDWQLVANWKE